MSAGGRRVCVLLSGGGRSLENLLRRQEAGDLDCEFVRVVASRRNIRGIDVARDAGIEVSLVARRDFGDSADFVARMNETVLEVEPDLVVMAGFLSHWPPPPALGGKVINIHPSLLPLFGGKGFYGHHVHEAVLGSGMRVSGCTVHFVDEAYDRGAVILQRSCPVLPDDDADSLAARVFVEECRALPDALRWCLDGWVRLDQGRSRYREEAILEMRRVDRDPTSPPI